MRPALLLVALVLAEPDLASEWRAMHTTSTKALLTIQAQTPDGVPVRGEIACTGHWYKYQDGPIQFSGEALPFQTDSRGAIVMNPSVEDEAITCWMEHRGQRGTVAINFVADATQVVALIVGE